MPHLQKKHLGPNFISLTCLSLHFLRLHLSVRRCVTAEAPLPFRNSSSSLFSFCFNKALDSCVRYSTFLYPAEKKWKNERSKWPSVSLQITRRFRRLGKR